MDVSEKEQERILDENIYAIMRLLAVIYPPGCNEVFGKKSKYKLTPHSLFITVFKLIGYITRGVFMWPQRFFKQFSNLIVLIFLGMQIIISAGCGGGSGSASSSHDGTNISEVTSIAVDNGNVYAGGYYYDSTGVKNPGYWLNGIWTALAPIDATKTSMVNSIMISGSSIYIGGWCLDTKFIDLPNPTGTIPNPHGYWENNLTAGYWLNGVWTALNIPNTLKSSLVTSIAVSGTDVYAGGICENSFIGLSTTGSWKVIALPGYWLNGTWTALTPLSASNSARVTSIVISGADVYAGGCCENSNDIIIPGYWLNGVWTSLTAPAGSYVFGINSMIVSGGNIYIAGNLINSSGIQIAGYWLNGTWITLNPVVVTNASEVLSIFVVGSDVYAGGYCSDETGVKTSGYWFNGVWNELPKLDDYSNSVVLSIYVDGTDIYAGGYSDNNSVFRVPGYWLNGVWIALEHP